MSQPWAFNGLLTVIPSWAVPLPAGHREWTGTSSLLTPYSFGRRSPSPAWPGEGLSSVLVQRATAIMEIATLRAAPDPIRPRLP